MFVIRKDNSVVLSPSKIQYVADNALTIIALFILMLAIGYDNAIVRIFSIASTVFLGFVLVYKWLLMKSIKWHITNEQIIYIRGVLNKQVNYIELYRVFDYREYQTFIEQLISTKKIIIFSGDKSHPKLSLFGINQKDDVVTLIRERVEINKQVKRVYEISNK